MAEIIGGFATSHTPLLRVGRRGDLWEIHAKGDPRNRELLKMPEGKRVTYDELLALADPKIKDVVNVEKFQERCEKLQDGIDVLNNAFGDADPDVVVMIGDDQSELFFDDNYPTINIYWGETLKLVPRLPGPDANEANKVAAAALGTEEKDWPVDSALGLHLIEQLMDRDFDVATSRYLRPEYGGTIGPATWYLDSQHTTQPRPFGMNHAISFPVNRWFAGKTVPIVPVTINTCYPPNWISPRRAYALGRAIREAVQSWSSSKRVAIACSGGLSHFVVDEELDRIALKGLEQANGEILTLLPRVRLQSATTEILNWVAVAGAMGDTKMQTLSYEPGYRTPAGTGCGCAVGLWEV